MKTRSSLIPVLGKIEQLLLLLPSRKNRVLSLSLAVAVAMLAIFVGVKLLGGRQAIEKVEAENAAIQAQIDQLRAESKGYEAILAEDNEAAFEDYVLRTAREHLGLSLPGDRAFIDPAVLQAFGQ
ncbi:MAG: septum formation initiator family protein [Oscillospiraceae bacterium]|jgi:cell division protein FtsB|nr:septum formation initiator family protein [Oscillospiraceae bacterium]